jgi:pteridine reductase
VGRQIALHLAALGYSIALHANRSTTEADEVAEHLRASGTEAAVLQGDLGDASVAEKLVHQVIAQWGRLDVLINSAAIWKPTPLESVTVSEIRNYFEVNATASFMAAKAAGLQMAKQAAGGVIINIGDWAVVRPYLDHAAYFPSKGAIEAMTRSLAVELAHRNPQVRVNCILPGPVLLSEDTDEAKAVAIAKSTLVKRVGTPFHIAHAVQFLIENDFVTGVCLPVDGGRQIYSGDRLHSEYHTG